PRGGMIARPLPRPFHAPRTLSFLQPSALRTPYRFIEARRVRRLVRLDGRPSVVEFRFPDTPRTAPLAGTPSAQLRIRVVRATGGRSGRNERRPSGPAPPRLAPTRS